MLGSLGILNIGDIIDILVIILLFLFYIEKIIIKYKYLQYFNFDFSKSK